MRFRFLGTGGSQPIPLPGCVCDLCTEARERGAPYTRYGYSMYLPAVSGIIDTSEFVAMNLNRWRVPRLEYVFLTHWHPDHVNGIRVLSMRDPEPGSDETFIEAKQRDPPTVVTTRSVYERACDMVSVLPYLIEESEWADVHLLDEEPFEENGVEVTPVPYQLAPDGPHEATGFVFSRGDVSLAVVSDDARHLSEDRLPNDLNAAVFECGYFTHGPDGDRIRSADGGIDDLTHEEIRERIKRVDPERTFLSHISHHYARSYDDYRAREANYDRIEFAYDGMNIEV